MKLPSASIVTLLHPAQLALEIVAGPAVSPVGVSTSVSLVRTLPAIVRLGPVEVVPTTRRVLASAPLAPVNESSPATGGSLTQVTVTDTVAVEPPVEGVGERVGGGAGRVVAVVRRRAGR